MEKKAFVILISVVAIFLVFSSSMSNFVAAENEMDPEPVLAQLSQPLRSKPLPSNRVQLTDPTTGKIIGYYDRVKKVIVFPQRNLAIPRKQIAAVSNKGYQLLKQQSDEMTKSKYKKRQPPPKWVTPTGDRGNGIVMVEGIIIEGNIPKGAIAEREEPSSQNCVALCWNLSEGGAYCRGCCWPVSEDACFCWEECSDWESSAAK